MIDNHLKWAKDRGIIFKYSAFKGIKVFISIDFARAFYLATSNEFALVLIHAGYVIKIKKSLNILG